MCGCKQAGEKSVVWCLKEAAAPYNGYMELHFVNEDSGIILTSQKTICDRIFKIREDSIFFDGSEFLVRESDSLSIISNDIYYGKFLKIYSESNKSLLNDSIYHIRNVEYVYSITDSLLDKELRNSILKDLHTIKTSGLEAMRIPEYEEEVN